MNVGTSIKTLKPMAIRICSNSAAFSACETNWSNVDLIVNKRCMKLKDAQVNNLLNCYPKQFARKLLARTGQEDYYYWAPPDTEEPYLSCSSSYEES